jgi:hypothetical protein
VNFHFQASDVLAYLSSFKKDLGFIGMARELVEVVPDSSHDRDEGIEPLFDFWWHQEAGLDVGERAPLQVRGHAFIEARG